MERLHGLFLECAHHFFNAWEKNSQDIRINIYFYFSQKKESRWVKQLTGE